MVATDGGIPCERQLPFKYEYDKNVYKIHNRWISVPNIHYTINFDFLNNIQYSIIFNLIHNLYTVYERLQLLKLNIKLY